MDNFASVCELLDVQPGNFTHFYPDLKVTLVQCLKFINANFEILGVFFVLEFTFLYCLSEAGNCEVAYFSKNSVFGSFES